MQDFQYRSKIDPFIMILTIRMFYFFGYVFDYPRNVCEKKLR